MAEMDLKFDEPEVCTELAQQYLQNKNEFHSIEVNGKLYEKSTESEYESDQFNNKIYYISESQYNSMVNENLNPNLLVNQGDTVNFFLALAQKIEENAQLFCELEFLNRKIPINDTKNVDLKLINQSLIFKSSYIDSAFYTPHTTIYVQSNTPLFHLGLFAYIQPSQPCTIVCSKTTVAVCTLFVELCNDVGLGYKVKLAILQEDLKALRYLACNHISVTASKSSSDFDKQLAGNCIGVVTAHCDVDSAVDAFLAAPAWYPWRLGRVLVQEPVVERFTSTLRARTRAAASQYARTAYQADNKMFLMEYFRDDKHANDTGLVVVEAYRTTKEALRLLEDFRPLAVSAWAGHGSEANEIAFGVDCPIVWINSYGLFNGPPPSAAALFTPAKPREYTVETAQLRLLKTTWLALTPATRLQRVRNALGMYHEQSQARIEGEVGLRADSAVTVDGNLCITIRKPVEIVTVNATSPNRISICSAPFLNYIIDGGAVLVLHKDAFETSEALLMEQLMKVGAPLLSVSTADSNNGHPTDPLYKVKAIWTSIGTIFAN